MNAISSSQGAFASLSAKDFSLCRIGQKDWRLESVYPNIPDQFADSYNDLKQVFEECKQANWDGYGAMPVSEGTYKLAYEFLGILPLVIPSPSLGAEPDGHISLEWYRSPLQMLSVSISPEGELHYAALIGTSKQYGTEPFQGEAPKPIVDLVNRVMAA